MNGPFDIAAIRRRESAVSAVINAVLSFGFFALVFGLSGRMLTMAAPDRFAIDFLPQGFAVSFMASLVPTLVIRGKLRKLGLARADVKLARIMATGLALGLASAVLLLALAIAGPVDAVPLRPALVFKIVYGALLGFACTRIAISSLFAQTTKERPA